MIVTALFAPADFAWLDGLRRAHFPPERNQLTAHLTLFHHLPPSAAPELDRRLKQATAGAPPAASITGPMSLGRGTALRVSSEELAAVRGAVAEAFHGLLTPQDAGGWRPHVTVQNKVEPAAARALVTELSVLSWPRPLGITGLAVWWYRGGPWELIRDYRFRS
ncbi:2'-5' RNA ligase family protein [Sphingomonas sp.]|uniref:2'-5' RNA ligase family protein n=1 Tax=Sphingomonas sp. TaxID=28214 RepID=UPI003AFFEAAC